MHEKDNWSSAIIGGNHTVMPSEDRDIAWAPVQVIGENRSSRWLILCDHASNRIPPWVTGGTLGVSDADMARHIAFDLGARRIERFAPEVKARLDALAAELADLPAPEQAGQGIALARR